MITRRALIQKLGLAAAALLSSPLTILAKNHKADRQNLRLVDILRVTNRPYRGCVQYLINQPFSELKVGDHFVVINDPNIKKHEYVMRVDSVDNISRGYVIVEFVKGRWFTNHNSPAY